MLASGCGTSTLAWLAVLLQLVDDLVVLRAEKLLLGPGQASHPSKKGSSRALRLFRCLPVWASCCVRYFLL